MCLCYHAYCSFVGTASFKNQFVLGPFVWDASFWERFVNIPMWGAGEEEGCVVIMRGGGVWPSWHAPWIQSNCVTGSQASIMPVMDPDKGEDGTVS
jgi:hypothetical protein